jgi:hypothetical protein
MVSMRQPPEFGFTTPGNHTPGVTTIDMTADGRMTPPPVSGLPWTVRIGIGAVIVAAVAGLAASAVVLLWLASILIPVAIVAAAIAYAALRFQLWRLRTRGGSAGNGRWDLRIDPRRSRS